MRHGGIGDALEELRSFQDPFEEFVGAALEHPFCCPGKKKQVHSINLFPHLNGDLFADGAGVFPCGGNAGINRVGIFPFEGDETQLRHRR